MDSNCNIITEIYLVILLVTAKSNIITVTKLLVTSYCPTLVMTLAERIITDVACLPHARVFTSWT